MHDFEKPKHTQRRRSATTSCRPRRSRCPRVKRQLLGKWPRGLPHVRELLLIFACVRAGANLRPNLETTSGEEIPCPDLRLRSGRNTSFRWIFRSWKSSGPTFVSTCSEHRFYCRQTCIDQDLGPTSGYHRQWPKDGEEREIRSFYSSTSSRPQSGVHVAVKSVHKGYHPYSQHCPDQAGL